MRNVNYIIILLFITSFSSCQSKQESKTNLPPKETIADREDCEISYNKYIEKFSTGEKDSALFYINKSIKCDPTKKDNIFYKAQLLISMNDFENAILVLDDLNSGVDDPTIKMQKGVLMLKINDTNSKKILEECCVEFKQILKPTSSNLFYKIALDNYFKGKEYSLLEVRRFKNEHKDKAYENQNINALENLIKSESKEVVLFKIFNIR